MVDAVLFDFGGTLFDYYPSNYSILGSVARQFGKNIQDTDPILSIAFQKQEEYIHTLLLQKKEYSTGWMTDQDWRRGDEILLETVGIHSTEAKEILAKRFLARKMHHYKIFPDAISTLEVLRKNEIKLGLVSNLPKKHVQDRYKMLNHSKLTEFFSSIVLSGERGVAKPNPAIFKIALEELHVNSPNNVFHVGDSYIFDAIGAKNSGITPILLDPNKGRVCDCTIIASLSEILNLLLHQENS
ncbi:MAG: HAD family hydrolase [Candidatus Lokiarchaeota archaeon]|nr:HAD family hydrolase [Candidatus Lokiarchaeota archaeon]